MPKAVRSIEVSSASGELLVLAGSGDRAAEAAGGLDRERDAGHRELARDAQVVGATRDLGRAEVDLRVAVDVEEVRREQVRPDVLVVDADCGDVDASR